MSNDEAGLRLAMASGRDLRASAASAGRAGFAGLTLGATAARQLDAGSAQREFRAILHRNNLVPAALRHRPHGKGLSPSCDVGRFVDELSSAMTDSRSLGFACVSCDLGLIPTSPTVTRPKPVVSDLGPLVLPEAADVMKYGNSDETPTHAPDADHVALAVDALRAVADVTDRLTVAVAFGTTLARDVDLSHLLSAIDCPLFGRELDPAASLESLERDVAEAIDLMPPLLHVVGNDAQGAHRRSRDAEIGSGDVPWEALTDVLRQSEFRGFITLPTASPARLPGL